jgi:chemotaxis signal transduction protein
MAVNQAFIEAIKQSKKPSIEFTSAFRNYVKGWTEYRGEVVPVVAEDKFFYYVQMDDHVTPACRHEVTVYKNREDVLNG